MNTGSKFKIARQGSYDGLCGIYSIVNFFSRLEKMKAGNSNKLAKKFLKTALKAIENDKKLTVQNLLAGFWQGQLIKAAEAVATKHRKDIKIITLAAFIKEEKISDVRNLVEVLKGRGVAILNLRKPGHWVLAYSKSSGALKYDDSASGKVKSLGSEVIARRCIDLKRGLVLLYASVH